MYLVVIAHDVILIKGNKHYLLFLKWQNLNFHLLLADLKRNQVAQVKNIIYLSDTNNLHNCVALTLNEIQLDLVLVEVARLFQQGYLCLVGARDKFLQSIEIRKLNEVLLALLPHQQLLEGDVLKCFLEVNLLDLFVTEAQHHQKLMIDALYDLLLVQQDHALEILSLVTEQYEVDPLVFVHADIVKEVNVFDEP